MSYYLVRSLGPGPYDKGKGLFGEVNTKFPGRDHASDGWIGDTSHAARKSSHNPDYNNGGAVRAVDIDNNGAPWQKTALRNEVVKAAVGDHRVWYVISNNVIWSRTYGWAARRYTGSNPHEKHVHVSVREVPSQWNDTSTWLTPTKPPMRVTLRPVSLSRVRAEFRKALGIKKGKVKRSNDVARLQRSLNALGYDAGAVDGICGKKTLNAWRSFETDYPKKRQAGRPAIPDKKSLGVMSDRRGFRIGK